MRKDLFLTALALLLSLTVSAQRDENFKYMRGSLYMMMVEHPTLQYNDQIEAVFKKMDIPERFNNHDLGVRVIGFANDENQLQNIKTWGSKQQIAKRIGVLIIVNVQRFKPAENVIMRLLGFFLFPRSDFSQL